jgi:hypothetical protein
MSFTALRAGANRHGIPRLAVTAASPIRNTAAGRAPVTAGSPAGDEAAFAAFRTLQERIGRCGGSRPIRPFARRLPQPQNHRLACMNVAPRVFRIPFATGRRAAKPCSPSYPTTASSRPGREARTSFPPGWEGGAERRVSRQRGGYGAPAPHWADPRSSRIGSCEVQADCGKIFGGDRWGLHQGQFL